MVRKTQSSADVVLANKTVKKIAKFLGPQAYENLFGTKELHYFTSYTGWTPKQVQDAIQLHDFGQFRTSELLFNGMMKVPRISGALYTRTQAIRTLPFSLKIKQGTPNYIVNAIQCLEDNFHHVLSPNNMVELLQRVIIFGYCFCSIEKKLVDGYWMPKLTPFTHYYQTYDYTYQKYRLWTDALIDPNREKNINDQGYKLVAPHTNNEWVYFNAGGIRPWIKGAIRPLGQTFAKLIHANDSWFAYNDFEAASKQILHTPAIKRETPEAREAVQVAARLRARDTFIEPEGYELKYLSSGGKGQSYLAFKDMIAECSNEIGIELLGNNMMQENKSSGSYASARVGEGIARDRIVGDIETLTHPLYEGPMRQFIEWNFTDNLYKTEEPLVRYAPYPDWHPSEDETNDPMEMAAASKSNADALASFLQSAGLAGIQLPELGIDWKEQARKCGMALLDNSLVEK